MRIIFMGSPEFSVGALKALAQAGHEIVAVYSQPPRPKGRGQGIEKTAVHIAGEEMGSELLTIRVCRVCNNDGISVTMALQPSL